MKKLLIKPSYIGPTGAETFKVFHTQNSGLQRTNKSNFNVRMYNPGDLGIVHLWW